MTHQAKLLLHIDELVLVGFPAADRERIGAAVEEELTRLLSGAPPAAWLVNEGGAARLDGGSFTRAAGAPPRQLGTQIAAAVHTAVTAPARAERGER